MTSLFSKIFTQGKTLQLTQISIALDVIVSMIPGYCSFMFITFYGSISLIYIMSTTTFEEDLSKWVNNG